jgi:hypothetical protein
LKESGFAAAAAGMGLQGFIDARTAVVNALSNDSRYAVRIQRMASIPKAFCDVL